MFSRLDLNQRVWWPKPNLTNALYFMSVPDLNPMQLKLCSVLLQEVAQTPHQLSSFISTYTKEEAWIHVVCFLIQNT